MLGTRLLKLGTATAALLLCAGAVFAHGKPQPNPTEPVNPLKKRVMSGKPLEVCDQGAFYIGGVPKVTNYATSSTSTTPGQVIIGQSYVQFQIPIEAPPVAAHHGARVRAHRRVARCDAGRQRRLADTVGARQSRDLRDGSAGTRKIRLRPERHQRGKGPHRQRQRGGRPGDASGHRRHFPQSVLDDLVRPHHPGGDEHRHRHDDTAWRSGRSDTRRDQPAIGRARQLPAGFSDPAARQLDRRENRGARWRPRAGAQPGQQ